MYLFKSYFLTEDLIYTIIFKEGQAKFYHYHKSPIRALEKEHRPIGGN